MTRGIEGWLIFKSDEDQQRFLSLLAHGIAKIGFKCYTWVLMQNHYHFAPCECRTVQKVAEAVARQMKIDSDEIFKGGGGNERSIFRKVVPALLHRKFGIPISEVCRYYGIGSVSVSKMLDEGEEYVRSMKVVIKQ